MGAAMVVGATGDVGKAIAVELAAAGRPLALVGRDPARLDELATSCRGASDVVTVVADLLDDAAPARAVEAARVAVGAIDVVVNAAGIFGPLAPLAGSDPDSWARTFQVNVLAPYRFTRALVPDMVHRRFGRIVNVSSLAALSVPTAFNSAYATSKVALNTWTSVLALELAGTGVTANAIHPGDLKSRMWDDIREAATTAGADGYADWARHVGDTGGDDPAAAGRFVAALVADPAEPTGRLFLLGALARDLAPSASFSLTPTVVPG
jgi:NAD(P)-dependent dehydrogenase (short-subunit alcohol dehydrogenase family)